MKMNERSLKVYRVNRNVLETAVEQAKLSERFEIARKLKNLGLSAEQIMQATDLSANEIEAL